jgi:hypothetical protein
MNNNSKRVIFFVGMFFTMYQLTLSTIIFVPTDYPTIQLAIVASHDNDTVIVMPGTYYENINFLGKNITVSSRFIVSENSKDIPRTIINGDSSSGSVATFSNGETSAYLIGFTITQGRGTFIPHPEINDSMRVGGGIFIRKSSPTLRNNIIKENDTWLDCNGKGGGIAIIDSSFPTFQKNSIINNSCFGGCRWIYYYGGGFWIDSTSVPLIGGSEQNGNNIYSNYAFFGKEAFRNGNGSIIDARYNYWGSCPPGSQSYIEPINQFIIFPCLTEPITSISEQIEESLHMDFSLSQNYPNPFNPKTNFRFQISDLGFVSLKIYNIFGSEIATLVNEILPAGNYEREWNAENFPSGMYFYRLESNGFSETKKLLLLK